MDMNKLLFDFYNEHKEDIAYICRGGSACVHYIKNPHDIDYFVVFKNKSDSPQKKRENFLCVLNLVKEAKKIDNRIVVIPTYLGFIRYWKSTEKTDQNIADNKYFVPIYLYLIKQNEIICGEDTEKLLEIDILEPSIKSVYIDALKDFMFNKEKDYNKYFPKALYHILTGIYIIQNNSYDLTNEQIENINIAHDYTDISGYNELYQWVEQTLSQM